METKELIPIRRAESYAHLDLLQNYMLQWFVENGSIAFEHGYKAYITFNRDKWQITYLDRSGVHVFHPITKQTEVFGWTMLWKRTLVKIANEVNKYYNYCLTQA